MVPPPVLPVRVFKMLIMKRLLTGFLFAALLLQAQTSPAQNVFTGKVVDQETGEPLAGASIQVFITGEPKLQGIMSDIQGAFSLNINSGKKARVTISYVGYKIKTISLQAGTIMPLLIRLEKIPDVIPGVIENINPTRHVPVEVRSIRAGDKAPFTKTDLRTADFEQLNLGQDVPFLLNQTPAVLAYSDAGTGVGYTGLRIRGTDASRINMTINGIPYNDAESQGIFFVDLPDFISSVSSVQVQRGVGGSSNGAGAFGATLSFSTKSEQEKPYVEFNNSYGSFETRKHTVKIGTGTLKSGFSADVRLSSIRSDGFIERAEAKLDGYYISAGYKKKNTSVTLNLLSGHERTYQAWNGVPESLLLTNRRYNSAGTEKPGSPYQNEIDLYTQDHYQLLADHRVNRMITLNTAFFLSTGKGYYEQYKTNEKYSDYGLPDPVINGATVTETDLVRQLWLDNDYYGQTFGAHYNQSNTSLILGGGWTNYKGKHFGEITWAKFGAPIGYRWYNLNAAKADVNSYLKWQQNIPGGWNIYADIQYRNVHYRINGFRNNPQLLINQQYHFINPKAGVGYAGKKIQVAVSYALANKEPNRDDFEAGGTNLPRQETLHDAELNIKMNAGKKLAMQLTYYYMYYRNQLVLTGKINDVGAYTRQNIPVSYRMGTELQAEVKPNNWFTISGNISFSSNKIKEFTEYVDDYDNGGQKNIPHRNRDIAFSPSVTASLSTEAQIFPGMKISWVNKYAGKQYLDNTQNEQRRLNSYLVSNGIISFKPPVKKLSGVQFLVHINNIFNIKYEPNGYTFSYYYGGTTTTENYYYPMAGRNFMAGLNIRL